LIETSWLSNCWAGYGVRLTDAANPEYDTVLAFVSSALTVSSYASRYASVKFSTVGATELSVNFAALAVNVFTSACTVVSL
jgi:hypothetical protein